MYEAGIKLTEEDFEFSKSSIKKVSSPHIRKLSARLHCLFRRQYVVRLKIKFRTLYAHKCRARYPKDIELVFDFIALERDQRIRYEKGVLYKSAVPGLSDYERQ